MTRFAESNPFFFLPGLKPLDSVFADGTVHSPLIGVFWEYEGRETSNGVEQNVCNC